MSGTPTLSHSEAGDTSADEETRGDFEHQAKAGKNIFNPNNYFT